LFPPNFLSRNPADLFQVTFLPEYFSSEKKQKSKSNLTDYLETSSQMNLMEPPNFTQKVSTESEPITDKRQQELQQQLYLLQLQQQVYQQQSQQQPSPYWFNPYYYPPYYNLFNQQPSGYLEIL